MPLRRPLLLAAALAALLCAAPAGAADPKPRHPGRSDPERKALLDALRPAVEKSLAGRKVIFLVTRLEIRGDFAFFLGKPLSPDGKKLSYAGTSYQAQIDNGAFDDGVMALFQKDEQAWKTLEWTLGATDYPCEAWAGQHGAPVALCRG